MPKDYYKTLGVEKGATDSEIKRAFRKLAHQYHPDKNGGEENLKKFKEINEAYQVLSNKEKRQQYDQFGANFDQTGGFSGGNPFGGGQGFGGFDFSGGQNMDFDLGDIFGSFFGGDSPFRSGRNQRGEDIQVDINISLKDAVFGLSESLSLRKKIKCQSCEGTGADKGTSFEECRTCGGSGHITSTVLGTFRTQTVCPDCRGKGKSIKNKCGACHGQGFDTENVDIKVEIPAGIDDGQSIRLSGQGNAGKNGAVSGDLYVVVHVLPEKGFERQGDDLITEYDIPFTMAALGGQIEARTIDGKVKLKIPSGTPSGKKFVLSDKGVAHLKARGRGDQIVIVNVDVPSKLTKKQRKLLEELDKEFDSKL
ncbi:molecular chaperone DnaJ [Patescibacteria group bacterium]|nr:molecular chaperone DnaJ [Patescibacteria group bacterium]